MQLFPVRKARIGLSLTAQAVTSIELRPSLWPSRRRHVRALKRQDLPNALIRPSTDATNISEVSALSKNIATLLGPRQGIPVSLSLPNQCAQIALLDFDVLPENPTECAALIRWRLEKDLQIPAADCRIAHRAFGLSAGGTGSDGPKHRMLVATVRNNVLTQYEQACEEAGLLPVEVGLQGLQLFDLSRDFIQQDDEWFFVSLLDEQFFFVAVRHAIPVMLRSKPLPKSPAHRQLELLASIQYYDELSASSGVKSQSSARTLYVLEGVPDYSSKITGGSMEKNSPSILDHTVTDSLRINVSPLTKDSLPITWPASDIHWTSGLSALASLSAQ